MKKAVLLSIFCCSSIFLYADSKDQVVRKENYPMPPMEAIPATEEIKEAQDTDAPSLEKPKVKDQLKKEGEEQKQKEKDKKAE
ncbi:MAG: hypothetical protein WCP39_03130 [Chlamydiota bacterium]